jgi:hypothetical protein
VKDTSDRHQFKGAIYVGAAVSAVMALLPYVNKLFLTVYVLGPLAGVWFAPEGAQNRSTLPKAPRLGFSALFME